MTQLLLLWFMLACTLVAVCIGRRRDQGGPLVLAYFLGLSLIHVPGVLAFAQPALGLVGREETRLGFELTLTGMLAFVAGAFFAKCLRHRRRSTSTLQADTLGRLGWRALGIGTLAYFVLLPISSLMPSLTSVVSAVATLLIIGLWLRLYGAAVAGDRIGLLSSLALLPLLPVATLATGGFIGYGVSWVLSVLAFLFVITRRRIWFYAAAPFTVFLGLSLFVTYMGQRVGIRDLVWHEHAGLSDRLERVSAIVTEFQFLDLGKPAHAMAINERLNQNIFVGTGVLRHEDGAVNLVYGRTVPWWALIPRAIWPDKPAVGGGGDLVAIFTGIPLAAGSSFGVGQVLEFYMNFGVPGVLIGFCALGFVLMWLDHGIMLALTSGDVGGLLRRAMPGLALMQPSGNLLEILVAVVAALVASRLLVYLRLLDFPGWTGRRRYSGSNPPCKVAATNRCLSSE